MDQKYGLPVYSVSQGSNGALTKAYHSDRLWKNSVFERTSLSSLIGDFILLYLIS